MSAPAKPWRVATRIADAPVDCRSQKAAYEAVCGFADSGTPCTVWHWENGDWRLYERVEPLRDPEAETEREAGE